MPVSHVVLPLALVLVSVGPDLHAIPVLLVVLPLAFVCAACLPTLLVLLRRRSDFERLGLPLLDQINSVAAPTLLCLVIVDFPLLRLGRQMAAEGHVYESGREEGSGSEWTRPFVSKLKRLSLGEQQAKRKRRSKERTRFELGELSASALPRCRLLR